jgi:hypothetical protein
MTPFSYRLNGRFHDFLAGKYLLLIALILAFSLSLIGATWGKVECWNLDQMAFRGVQHNGLPWGGYLKPPLHTYMNHLLVKKPIEAIMHHNFLGGDLRKRYPYQLVGTRLLTILLFCGTVFLVYSVVSQNCGTQSAALLALITATSAGLLKFNHFATADSPLLFWMMTSFALSLKAWHSGKVLDSLLAGLLAGLAAADKYNGLGVAIAIPVVLLLRSGWRSILSPALWVGAAGVPLGFIIGNPGAVFDTKNFVQDFLYNLYTTPVYTGKTTGSGYWDFITCFPELIGWPALVLISVGLLLTGISAFQKRLGRQETALIVAAAAVFGFYYLMIGRFPRMADRFVLPVIPFLFLIAAPGIQRIPWKRFLYSSALFLTLAYNILCCIQLGERFRSDPRTAAQHYAIVNFPKGAVIENTYSPDWSRLPEIRVKIENMPAATGRSALFSRIFGENKVILKGIEKYELAQYPEETFTLEGLKKRNPDFVAFSNQAYQFTGDDQAQRFYRSLDDGKSGYTKVFEASWKPQTCWAYPKDIDFLVERMIILKRNNF